MKANNKKRVNFFVRIAAAVFILFCLVTVVTIQLEYNELEEKKAELEREKLDKNINIERLQNDLNTPIDEEYIIRVAKDKLNLRLPEEIIFYNDLVK
ncbi:MAG: cell division protein FtsL [Clostridia bacterium]|nr:cell division protein FtsL [Clostridia bacterium]